MHRNENKYDQLFRNRLRDLTHPVRNELWSRIHSGIEVPKTSVPLQPLRKFWPTFAQKLSLSVAAAALAITLGIIYFTHKPPSIQPVNHYSKTTPAIAPAQSTGKSSVTPRDSSRDRLSESPTAVTRQNQLTAADHAHAAGDHIARHHTVGDRLALGGHDAPASHLSPEDRITNARSHHISAATATMPGTSLAHQLHHNGNPVTLPALALTSIRSAIVAGTPGLKSTHNNSNSPAKTLHFRRTGYVSLYASPDFPNHNYTWSYTAGARLTFQFSPHWSFTAGLEYARVNVPTQVIPPVGYGDTLHSFYFSNYEVPVLFGYTRTFRHSTLTVNGGAILNLYFHRSTGVWVFNLPDRDSYGAVLGVDYSHSLDRHLAIFAQPYARYSISNYRMFTQPQRWSFGTLLGIKYQL